MDVPTVATETEARSFIVWAVDTLGPCFHPDSLGHQYINTRTGERTFSPEEADAFDFAMANTFDLLDDPYGDALDLIARIR